jgi:hypothetical protein
VLLLGCGGLLLGLVLRVRGVDGVEEVGEEVLDEERDTRGEAVQREPREVALDGDAAELLQARG